MNDKSSNGLSFYEHSQVLAAERAYDRSGTHPGSSPPVAPVEGPSFLPVPDIDPTDMNSDDGATVQLTIDAIRSRLAARRPQPVAEGLRPGTLVDPNGNAVLGSAGFSEEQIAEYKRDNPGSKTIE